MKLSEIIRAFESVAPPVLQESYDNSGLIIGSPDAEITRALLCLDSTEEVIDEAIRENCNLIIAHHPIIFSGLKKLTSSNHVERAVEKAVKNGIAIYACHTNLDNILKSGVNSKIAERLGLKNCRVLVPKSGQLNKLIVFVPHEFTEAVKFAMFEAGAGQIGQYDECSFGSVGEGTFRALSDANPFVGNMGESHTEPEVRLEVVVPEPLIPAVIEAMKNAHPYEEVAYDLLRIQNTWGQAGSGLIGFLHQPLNQQDFLKKLKENMELEIIRFTDSTKEKIEKIAVCGGAGSFLIKEALRQGADAFITADVKYHEFFDAEKSMLVCDIGHFESEKYTIMLFAEILSKKFPNFAVLLSKTKTNPLNYYYS